MVGFPGETEDDFQELCDFVQEYQFERVGVFPFYNEPGCLAYKFPEQVSEKIKKKMEEINGDPAKDCFSSSKEEDR